MTWRVVVASVTVAVVSSIGIAPITAHQQVREGASPRPAPVTSGSALVTGTLTSNDQSPRPVRRATLILTSSETSAARVAVTDDNGRFRFGNLPAGRFNLVANRLGFVRTYYGARRPGRGPGTDVVLADGQRMDLTITMARGAVITGKVIDAFGKPLTGVGVQALAYSAAGGPQGSLSLAGINVTDDRGVYRIFGLAAGRYQVVASGGLDNMGAGSDQHSTSAAEVQWAEQQLASTRMSGAPLTTPPPYGRSVAYVPTYFPGTADPSAAAPVDLASGDERTIDFALTFTPTTTLSGMTVTPAGQPAKGTRLTVIPRNSAALPDVSLALLNGVLSFVRAGTADGTFQIGGLPPGEYTIVARGAVSPATPGSQPDPPLWGELRITATGTDQSGLEIRLQPGVTVSGSVAIDASAQKPPENLTIVRVALAAPLAAFAVPVNSPAPVPIKADGSFAIAGVAPGAYALQVTVPPVAGPWTPRSAVIDGHDVLDTALEVEQGKDLSGLVVTLTDRVTKVSGTLLNGAGKGTPDYAMVAFPTNRALWTRGSRRIKASRTATDGTFVITGLPAGEYYLAAVTDYDQPELFDPSFLGDLLTSARKITLADGEAKTQDFRISGG
jgi:hypothetical protein